jgi:AcrR family transcriptional regulator
VAVEPGKRKWTRSPERLAQYDAERESIMRAAYRLMDKSERVVSVQEILESAGLSTRAFYRHFASKDELVLTMYRTDNERVAEALWTATGSEPDAWAALRLWVEISLSVVFDQGPERHSRVLGSAEVKSAAGWAQEFLDGIDRHTASLEALLRRGALEGRFGGTEEHKDAQVLFGATQHFNAVRMKSTDVIDREGAIEAIMRAARRLLAVDEGSTLASATRRRSRPVAVAD